MSALEHWVQRIAGGHAAQRIPMQGELSPSIKRNSLCGAATMHMGAAPAAAGGVRRLRSGAAQELLARPYFEG